MTELAARVTFKELLGAGFALLIVWIFLALGFAL